MSYLQNQFWGIKSKGEVLSVMQDMRNTPQIPLVKQISLDDRRKIKSPNEFSASFFVSYSLKFNGC
jgi:hypothetical protein